MTKYPTNSEGSICRYSTKMVFLKTVVFSCEFCAIFQNQATKFGQLIECEKYFSSKIKLKMRSRDQFQTSFCLTKKLYKRLKQMVKVAGMKLIKKRLILHIFFPKTLFTEHFWMIASADSSVQTNVLSHFYNHTFFIFSFMFFLLLLTQLVRGFQAPSF